MKLPKGWTLVGGTSSQNYWILGDAFLFDYYAIFDKTNRKVGFVHSLGYPVLVQENGTPTIHYIIFSVLALFILGCVVYAIRKCSSNKNIEDVDGLYDEDLLNSSDVKPVLNATTVEVEEETN